MSPQEQTIELDEVLLLGLALTSGLLIFGIRRHLEQKREARHRLAAEHLVRKLAFQDPLTGLPNRRKFEEALQLAIAQPPAAGSAHAVMMLDLNGFKKINDTFGHATGDEVLIVVAQRLMAAVRSEDMVARLGGDEFVVLAPHVLGSEGAANIANRIVAAFAAPVTVSVKEHQVGTGIGIALLPADAGDQAEVMRKADVALYRAKEERRSAVRFFASEMDQTIQERDKIERALAMAIRNDDIEVRFRANIDLQTGAIVGFEALPYWKLSGDESFESEQLLAIAEGTGLVHELGALTLKRACAAAREWPNSVGLSIDIWPGQVADPSLGAAILAILDAAAILPTRLEVEVAENIIVSNLAAAKQVLAPLRQAGVKVTLDKFGTGYSNLYHLQELSFDKVKIDRSFTERLGEDDADRVVKALAGLGQGLGIVVGADGFSGAGSRAQLLSSGVHEGQADDHLYSATEARQSFAEVGLDLARSLTSAKAE
jgi:diguanylate cyclase (GGDEF)-like protein